MSDEKDCGCGQNNQPNESNSGVSELINKVFVPSSEYETRMAICKTCEHFESILARCKICGCFMEAKTRLRGMHCALDQIGEEPKW